MKYFVTYVPVVHRAIIDLAREEQATVLVLDAMFIAEYPELQYDFRAIRPFEAVSMLRSLGLKACLFSDRPILPHLKSDDLYLVPDDEMMRTFAERNLHLCQVEFRQVFIRWDKINTTSENDPDPDITITRDDFDRAMMEIGCREAQLTSDWWRQVGAVAVRDRELLSIGANRMKPTDFSNYVDGDIRACFGFGEHLEICGTIHAEAMVIARAARDGVSLVGCDFYCTTFPCPQCARLIGEAGAKRLIYEVGYSVSDARRILKAYGVEVSKLVL